MRISFFITITTLFFKFRWRKVPTEISEAISNSKEARNEVEKTRQNATNSDNWNEFEQAMTNDTEWKSIRNYHQEHKNGKL